MAVLFFPLLLPLTAATANVPPPAEGFALIVTNNRSLSLSRPDLQYADDDGGKYAALFAEELGAANVLLLTDFDPQSRLLFPDWSGRALSPTQQNLDEAVRTLATRLARASATGATTDLYIVLAGHGDVDHGQGYIELADGRLTARDLDERVLARLPATRAHLILDSCNSYFMLNPRKPGGKRFEVADKAAGLLDKYPHLGAVISTSAEAVTYEWSELQSGIFSYELRSGLRGAADVDGDGSISYAELAAFVAVANQEIENDLYRPKVFAHGPSADNGACFLEHRAAERRRQLVVAAAGTRRLTVRDTHGVRLLDLNKEDGTAVSITLPEERVDIYEQIAAGERPTVIVRGYEPPADAATVAVALESLSAASPDLAGRGEAPVFSAMFASPFGKHAFVAAQESAQAAGEPTTFGITQRDVEQLRLHIDSTVALDRDQWLQLTYGMATAWALASASALMFLPQRDLKPNEKLMLYTAAGAVPVALLLKWAIRGLRRSPYEKLQLELAEQDFSTEESRGRAVLALHEEYRRIVAEDRWDRRFNGFFGMGAGLLFVANGVAMKTGAGGTALPNSDTVSYSSMAMGAVFIIWGLVQATVLRSPAERTWAMYEAAESGATADPLGQPPESASTPSLLPTLGVSDNGGFVGLGGTF